MFCPRLDHFVRINADGTFSTCGHLTQKEKFNSLDELFNGTFVNDLKETLLSNDWPMACQRCKETESINNSSIRLNSLKFHEKQTKEDYLVLGGVLDNVCNLACHICSEKLSTKIGSLTSRNYIKIDNTSTFSKLPLDRIVHLDINGGEPSASKNYKNILRNLPSNVKSIRINTNGTAIIQEIENLIEEGIDVTVTISLDGIKNVHEYSRWPSTWETFCQNIIKYKSMDINLNCWTTVSVLNVHNLDEIFNFVDEHKLSHSYALLKNPSVYNISNTNNITLNARDKLLKSKREELNQLAVNYIATSEVNNNLELTEFIETQDNIRNIKYSDYIK